MDKGGINKDVVNIMPFINAGTVGIEIGVWNGDTSEKFVNRGVKHLHLVDSWSVDAYLAQKNPEKGSHKKFFEAMYTYTRSTNPDDTQKFFDTLYGGVVKRFTNTESVTIHKMTSADFFKSFTEKVDWIYVDGAHSYDECLEDLIASYKIIKPGGWLIGDDYEWDRGKGKPGVTQAVNEFISKYNLKPARYGQRQFIIGVTDAPIIS